MILPINLKAVCYINEIYVHNNISLYEVCGSVKLYFQSKNRQQHRITVI